MNAEICRTNAEKVLHDEDKEELFQQQSKTGGNNNLRKLMFKSQLPVNNKKVFVMIGDISKPIKNLKLDLLAREGLDTPIERLSFFIDGVELEDDQILSSYDDITHKSIITIEGAYHSFKVSTSSIELPVKWSRHITVTEMLKTVWYKTGINLQKSRFRILDKEIPIKGCYKYPNCELSWDLTLAELGFAKCNGDPACVKFCRFLNGNPEFSCLNFFGSSTVRDVHNEVMSLERRSKMGIHQKSMSWSNSPPSSPVAASSPSSKASSSNKFPPSSSSSEFFPGVGGDKYDDESERVSPLGNKRVFKYTVDIPGYLKNRKELNTKEPYLCYHPLHSTPPSWVDIDADPRESNNHIRLVEQERKMA